MKKPKLIDLGFAMAKLSEVASKDKPTITILTLVYPSINDEGFGFEPAQSVLICGRDHLRLLANEIIAFCEEKKQIEKEGLVERG